MSIHGRPEVVQSPEKVGDWDADLMFCRRRQPVLVLHEHASRPTLAAELAGESAAGKTLFVAAVETSLDRQPKRLKLQVVEGFRKAEVAELAPVELRCGRQSRQ
jgi:IS30 family transposase